MNVIDPIILFFLLGLVAGLLRSELRLPAAIYEFVSILLLLSIGLKGGIELAKQPFGDLLPDMLAVVAMGFFLALLAFPVLRYVGRFKRADAASIAAHYGSVSVGTYAVAVAYLGSRQIVFDQAVVLRSLQGHSGPVPAGDGLDHRDTGGQPTPVRAIFGCLWHWHAPVFFASGHRAGAGTGLVRRGDSHACHAGRQCFLHRGTRRHAHIGARGQPHLVAGRFAGRHIPVQCLGGYPNLLCARRVGAHVPGRMKLMEGHTRKLLTIVTEAAVEGTLIRDIERLGAHGYTITDARGKGGRGVRNAGWEASGNIRIEVVCDADTASTIATYLQTHYYDNYAMILFVSSIDVLRSEKF